MVFRTLTSGAPLQQRLDRVTGKMSVVLGISHDERVWHTAAQIAIDQKAWFSENQRASALSSGTDIDNRLAWRLAMASKSFPVSLVAAAHVFWRRGMAPEPLTVAWARMLPSRNM